MDNDQKALETIMNSKTVEEIYKDALSAPAKESSKILTDLVKTARLFLAPVQILASFQDRFENFLKEKANKIPQNRLIESPTEIIGPSIEKMKYINDDSVLWEMFEELLLKSIDKDNIHKAHPSFVHIISQLSHDEAVLLFNLTKKEEFNIIDTFDYDQATNLFINRKVLSSEIPLSQLQYSNNENLYYNHLESLSLISWPIIKQDPIVDNSGKQIGVKRLSKWGLTDFGKLFIDACIPKNGFKNMAG